MTNISANENTILEAEVRTLQRKLQRRDHEIMKQERELHKLRVRYLIIKNRKVKRSEENYNIAWVL